MRSERGPFGQLASAGDILIIQRCPWITDARSASRTPQRNRNELGETTV